MSLENNAKDGLSVDVSLKERKIKETGYNQLGFRPVGNNVVIILTDNDLEVLESPYAPSNIAKTKAKKSKIHAPNSKKGGIKELYKGEAMEKAQRELDKSNRTFTVAALPVALIGKEDIPDIGDEIGLAAGTMTEVKITENGVDHLYGIIPAHRIITIHKEKIDPNEDKNLQSTIIKP